MVECKIYHSSHWRSLNIHVIYLRKISKIVVRNASLHITTIKWQWIQPNQTLHLMKMASVLQTLYRNFLLLFFLFYHLQTYYFLRWIGLQPNQQITFNLPFQWCHFSHHHHLNLLIYINNIIAHFNGLIALINLKKLIDSVVGIIGILWKDTKMAAFNGPKG